MRTYSSLWAGKSTLLNRYGGARVVPIRCVDLPQQKWPQMGRAGARVRALAAERFKSMILRTTLPIQGHKWPATHCATVRDQASPKTPSEGNETSTLSARLMVALCSGLRYSLPTRLLVHRSAIKIGGETAKLQSCPSKASEWNRSQHDDSCEAPY